MSQTASASEESRQARPLRRLAMAFVNQDSYGLVLLLIVITYAMSISLRTAWAPTAVIFVQMATVWLALRTSKSRKPARVIADTMLVVAGLLAIFHVFVPDAVWLLRSVFAASTLLYFVAPFAIMRHIAFRSEVDQETVLGAIAAYLMIGMFFAFTYRFVGATQGAPFFGSNGDGTMPQDLFFSFTTLTTTGYGNLIPASTTGQSIAVFEMLFGQLFLVTAVAKVVSSWRPKNKRAPGPVDRPPPDA